MKDLSFFCYALVFIGTLSCGDSQHQDNSKFSTDGEKLSHLYCASCHQYPEPSLLDKDTWENYILPRMGYMYGIYSSKEERAQLFENNKGGDLVKARNLFPNTPQLPIEDWESIMEYYVQNAPANLSNPTPKKISKELTQFIPIFPKQKVNIPSSTLVQFSEDGSIYLGDAMTKSFSIFSTDLTLLQTGTVEQGAVSLYEGASSYWLTVMGSFSPSDAPEGLIVNLSKNKDTSAQVSISGLQRPVHSSYADVDQDGDQDIVVCEFGKWTGALSLYRKEGNSYKREVLHPQPGAIKAYVQDMNKDGHQDIIALFAQGDEGIDIFYNDGKGNFNRKRVLEFSPSMGGSFMKLMDYNKDGFMDILFTAGDNADYKPILKPWHGIYVFVNDGKNNFVEDLFQPLNGAYNAVVDDFDLDGDMDIAAISFFPDWVHTPEESFVYFENDGKETFSLTTFPQVNKGRWVVMDASDYDTDGDIDLILGSLAFEVVPKLGYVKQWIKDGIPFVVLENTKF